MHKMDNVVNKELILSNSEKWSWEDSHFRKETCVCISIYTIILLKERIWIV